ncbi:MAG: beta-N-acetylhexosaminidase [Candidatus Eremiobacteraeota bacterium]|nr:beta-N-acetylhexosaminidase [Candidatus Eremiobacteraeota bacterium]
MSDLARLCAGILCVGIEGTEPADARAALEDFPVAGVVLFARNVRDVAQVRALTDAVRELFGPLSPFIATDQEGGRVARLRRDVVEIPSMMALGATVDAALAARAGAQIAHDLRRAGVNLDFAPVLDLARPGRGTVIGTRSFGENPDAVTALGGAFAGGLQRAGVVATYKHFPGHGATEADSHETLPVVDATRAQLRAADLRPFAALLPEARAVMTAHVVVRAFDPDSPATTSREILQTLLREEMHFRGVCFTDCMEMDAIGTTIGTAEGAVRALRAGADCVTIGHRIELARETASALERAVRDGRLPLKRLSEAYERVQRLRRRLSEPLPVEAPAPDPEIGREIARRAVTRVRGSAVLDARECTAITFEADAGRGVEETRAHVPGLGDHAHGLEERRLSLDPDETSVEEALHVVSAQRKRPILLLRRAHVHEGQHYAARRFIERIPETVVISTREPFELEALDAGEVLAIFDDGDTSFAGLADVLFATRAR